MPPSAAALGKSLPLPVREYPNQDKEGTAPALSAVMRTSGNAGDTPHTTPAGGDV